MSDPNLPPGAGRLGRWTSEARCEGCGEQFEVEVESELGAQSITPEACPACGSTVISPEE